MKIFTSNLFAKVYNYVFKSIINHDFERYTFTGGRASAKSSFISLVIVLLVRLFPRYNALILRRTAKSLRNSVFEQIVWAINAWGFKGFKIPKSRTAALPIVYTRKDGTEQVIIFAGCDDPEKLKSIKVSNGYIAILWVEEKTEIDANTLHNVRISALRGGDKFYIFESYNPPSATRHWCNEEARIADHHRLIVHTTYKDIPEDWLGLAILHDIETTKKNNPRVYENIYLGIPTGTGINIFENVELREITDAEIDRLENFYYGIDWGYFPDPFRYCAFAYEQKTHTLYCIDELSLYKHGNYEASEKLKEHLIKVNARYIDAINDNYDKQQFIDSLITERRITADSAEPKSVGDFRSYGYNLRGAIKGQGSLEAGFKWLQTLNKIVIDPTRCPKTADEFTLYEYEIDKKTEEIMEGFPQGQPDHSLACARYALECVWRKKGN